MGKKGINLKTADELRTTLLLCQMIEPTSAKAQNVIKATTGRNSKDPFLVFRNAKRWERKCKEKSMFAIMQYMKIAKEYDLPPSTHKKIMNSLRGSDGDIKKLLRSEGLPPLNAEILTFLVGVLKESVNKHRKQSGLTNKKT